LRAVLLASILFMLIMGIGMVWNIVPLAELQTVTIHTPTTSVNTTNFSSNHNNGNGLGTTHASTTENPVGTETSNSVDTTGSGSSGHSSSTTISQIQTSSSDWKNEWTSYAQVAWQFFKPGVGVSPTTGLIYASPYWHRFTDWDLGGYILAVLSAEKLGLISSNGLWGADYRLGLVLNFLDSRPLTANNVTFQFYDSDTGTVSPDGPPNAGNPIDEGRLLIALYDTKLLHPELESEILAAVHHVNYTYFASDSRFASGDDYSRYAALGFNLWGFKTASPPSYSAPPAGTFITAEAVISAVLEGVNDTYITAASQQVYFAQYAAYNRTGVLMALSEGQYPPYLDSATPYVYEAIEVPSGATYTVQTWQGQNVTSSPEAFTKIGFAFYAVYKSSYGAFLVRTFANLTATNGYQEGILTATGRAFNAVSDNSNIMIMEACAYAVNPTF